jgi:hypothetical protein
MKRLPRVQESNNRCRSASSWSENHLAIPITFVALRGFCKFSGLLKSWWFSQEDQMHILSCDQHQVKMICASDALRMTRRRRSDQHRVMMTSTSHYAWRMVRRLNAFDVSYRQYFRYRFLSVRVDDWTYKNRRQRRTSAPVN